MGRGIVLKSEAKGKTQLPFKALRESLKLPVTHSLGAHSHTPTWQAALPVHHRRTGAACLQGP